MTTQIARPGLYSGAQFGFPPPIRVHVAGPIAFSGTEQRVLTLWDQWTDPVTSTTYPNITLGATNVWPLDARSSPVMHSIELRVIGAETIQWANIGFQAALNGSTNERDLIAATGQVYAQELPFNGIVSADGWVQIADELAQTSGVFLSTPGAGVDILLRFKWRQINFYQPVR